jgi:TonB-linked SusC/RagA family outer membrane protein
MKSKINQILTLCLLMVFQVALAQQTVSGTVTDQNGQPIPGATVVLKGTSTATTADFDGNFTIAANNGDVVVVSYVGFNAIEVTVDSAALTVSLESSTLLDEVVVTSFGQSQKRESLTGSVGTVSAAALTKRNVTNPIASIEGNVTGVQFTSTSGQPGSGPGLVIRGVGTLNGSATPLYVVDGAAFEGSLNSINQDDIESINVLKGASPMIALYGARAANGVVIITTKKGSRDGGVKVNMTTQYSIVDRAIKEYEEVGPGQYYELMWEAYKNSLNVADPAATASATIYDRLGYNPFNVPNDQIVGTDGKLNPNAKVIYESLNWLDYLQRTGSRVNNSVNVSSGSDKHSVFFSASHATEDGYVIESSFERTTGRLNADFSPNKWLRMGGGLNMALNKSVGLGGVGASSIVNPFGWAKNLASIYPVYVVDLNGKIVRDAAGNPQYDYGEGYSEYNIQSRPFNPGRHGIAEAYFNDEDSRTNNYGIRYYADVNITEGLTFSVNYARDFQDFINKSYENDIVGDGAPTGRYGETRYRRTVENSVQKLNYETSFGDHNIQLLLGHESFDRDFTENSGLSNTQVAAGIYEFANFTVPTSLDGFSSEKNTEGYFSRLGYDYQEKYYLNIGYRRDGSSVFSDEVRWGDFYAVGFSWSVDKESFMDNVDFVNRLKLRASYGEVGNDNLGDFYISQPRYSLTSNAGAPGIVWTQLGNNALTWESVSSFDVAAEFSLFDNKLYGSVEYYKKTSSDLLYNLPIAPSNGLIEKPENVGDIFNAGVEVSLNGRLINTPEFNWTLGLQASSLDAEVTSLPDPFVNGSKRWEEGRSQYAYFIYHYAGVDASNGDALYYMFEEDDNGNSIPVLDADGNHETSNDWGDAGKAYTGDLSTPDIIGSVRNSFNYKNFSLDVLLTFASGGKILDYGYANMMHTGSYASSYHPDALNAWRNPGDVTDVPRLEVGNTDQVQTMSTRFLTDASYVALRNVNLSYSLDKELTDKLGVDQLSIFVTGENLFINAARQGLDPQFNISGTPSGISYSPASSLSLGAKLNF